MRDLVRDPGKMGVAEFKSELLRWQSLAAPYISQCWGTLSNPAPLALGAEGRIQIAIQQRRKMMLVVSSRVGQRLSLP